MTQRFSLYLDLVRFLAAVIVLLSHFAYPRFSDGDYLIIRQLNLGSDAVVIFFVLSGLIIAYSTDRKAQGAGGYSFDRATRIFSVALPALALTFLCDRLGATLAPDAYSGWWYNPVSAGEMFLRGLTFSNEFSGFETRLGTNGPYWSISYEVAYYALFAAVAFTTGSVRILLVASMILLFGLNIILLAPIWIMGVFAYRQLCKGDQPEISNTVLRVGAVLPLLLYGWFLVIGLPHALVNLTVAMIGENAYAGLRFSNEFLWNTLIGMLFTLHLTCMGMMLRRSVEKAVDHASVGRVVRWLAGGSFSLYLVHYPLMQFLSAVLPDAGSRLGNHALLLVLTVAGCFLFAEVFERRLGEFRAIVRRLSLHTRFAERAE